VKELASSSFQHFPSPSNRGDAEGIIEPAIIADDTVSLRDYGRVICKHLWLIAACCGGAMLATTLVVLMTTPIYTAEASLLIERWAPQVLDMREVLSEPLASNENDFYKTQYEILKSRSLAAQVIQELQLETDPTFTGGEQDQGFGASREDPVAVRPELIDAYLGMLAVQPIQRTRLVKIAFNTPDPELSARLANAHVRAYIQHRLGLHTRANEDAQRFLEGKLGELKARVEASEAALNRYRRRRQIISLEDKENIVVERLADLNKRLTAAEADRIGLESQVRLIRKRDYDSLPDVINNALIRTLKEELARLRGEYAHLSTQFKPGYPRLDQLRAQVEETRRRLQQEVQKTVAGIESAYMAAEATEKQLGAKMAAQKAEALRLKDASVEYAILAREVDTNRQLHDSVLQRMKETGVAAELRASNAFVIDQATPPRYPSKPQKKKSLLLSALLGLTGGIGLALVVEYLDNRLKTPQEVERYLRLPNLGIVPDFLRLGERYLRLSNLGTVLDFLRLQKVVHAWLILHGWRRPAPQKFPHTTLRIPSTLHSGKEGGLVLAHHPLRLVSEAYRTLRTAILLSRAEKPPQTILVTSATHSEGKTATVVNTAIVFAQMGVKVLVIDADLRRPRCHEVLGVQNGAGLTEILTGLREPQEVIQPTHTAGLFFLSGGATPPNPADIVGSEKMRETLTSLQGEHDYILIDSPPVMLVSDAVLLSTVVEGVVLVVDVQETPKQVIREACTRLNYARAKLLGTVLNRVDIRKGAYAYYYEPYEVYNRAAGAEVHRG
jgi:succinoglycan biosynthesis transport protein ExoP